MLSLNVPHANMMFYNALHVTAQYLLKSLECVLMTVVHVQEIIHCCRESGEVVEIDWTEVANEMDMEMVSDHTFFSSQEW